jgi:hypothetical protein
MSQIEVNKVIPQSGTGVQLGESGDTITIPAGATITNNGTASGFGSADTEKVKVSSNDTTAGFLNGKLVAGTNISLTEGSDGGNETLTAALSGTIGTSQIADSAVTNAKLGSGSFSNITGVGTLSSGLTLSDHILFDTASKGIYLGVTSATASNLLDDYEEGTWTPICVGSSSTGSVSMSGTYTRGLYNKIGNKVYIHCVVVWSSLTGTGNLEITGIPFPSKNIAPANGVNSSFTSFNGLTVPSGKMPFARIPNNSNKITMLTVSTGGGGTSTLAVDTAGELYFNITYLTDS